MLNKSLHMSEVRASDLSQSLLNKKFFEKWNRQSSDAFRSEVIRMCLGSTSDEYAVSTHQREIQDLPPIDFSSSEYDLNRIQSQALLTKDVDFKSNIDREKVAYEKFLHSEQACRETNRFLRQQDYGSEIHALIHYACMFISRVLGPCPSLSDLDFSFGPGAASSCRGKTSARFKLSTQPSTSRSSKRLISEFGADRIDRWTATESVVCPAILEFVPKSYKTHRAIVIEPSLNGYIQKGIGSYLKTRLFKSGINLFDQTVSQQRARLASISGSHATVDLSSASDSISYFLVLELLPPDWVDLLDACRSEEVFYKGERIALEKFSSMGNGYTFELESLIFASICHANRVLLNKRKDDFTVYGDDIIVPVDEARPLINCLSMLGFQANIDKTFISGPFRESCGADYHLGIDIRPFFIKDRMCFSTLFSFYNFLTRKEHFDRDGGIRAFIMSVIPPKLLLFGPDGFGDGHLTSSAPLKPYRRNSGWAGFIFETWAAVPLKDETVVLGDQLLPFYLVSRKGFGEIDGARLRLFRYPGYSPISGYFRDTLNISERSCPYTLRNKGYMQAKKIQVYVLNH